MKILCFIYSLGPGGAERVMSLLASAWSEKGHQIIIVTYDGDSSPFYPLHPEIRLIHLRLSRGKIFRRIFNHIARVPSFRKVIKETCPDIILSFMSRTNCLVLLSAIGLDIPVIVSERTNPRLIKPGLLYDWLRNRLYSRAKALVTLGSEQADWFKPITRQTVTIPNPVFPCETSGQFINKKRIVLGVGRLGKEKGFDLLINAFSRIAQAYPDWKLIILGEGPERKNLENLVGRYGISKQVELPGVILNVHEFYNKAAFLVLSSRFEGFPNVVVEALACGCPVVATDCVDTIRDIVTREYNGLIVPPEDVDALEMAMAKMMKDNDLRSYLGNNARKSVEKFHISRITKMWEDLFNEVLKNEK